MSSSKVAVWHSSQRHDKSDMILEGQSSSEDQFYTYSDDDSGSLNDSYFLPPTSPPDERNKAWKRSGRMNGWREGRQENYSYHAYHATLQPWAESDTQPLKESADPQNFSSRNQPLTSESQSSYGTVTSAEHPDAHDERNPNLHDSNVASFSHVADKKRLQKLQRKQLEHIAREKAVHQIRGTVQDLRCRDVFWAALFVVQLLLVAFAAVRFGSGVVLSDKDTNNFVKGLGVVQITDTAAGVDVSAITNVDDVLEQLQQFDHTDDVPERLATSLFTIDYQNVISLCLITGFYACVLSILTVGFMLIIAKSLIQTALVFSIGLSIAWGCLGIFVPGNHFMIPSMGFVALFLTLGYTVLSWDRIPFNATNLNVALCAMRSSADILLVGLGMLLLAFAWCVMWSTAFIGIVDTINTRDCEGIDDDDTYCTTQATHSHIILYILLVFSFFWTNVIIKNITQVTVAKAVGTWWFRPEEMSVCCTSGVTASLIQSFTTSLGPVCFGSLVVGPCQYLTTLADICCVPFGRHSCERDEVSSNLSCPCRCLDSVVDFARSCNRWSYTYIGMYRYGFLEGGAKAMDLFETREWMEVVSDNLIHNVLLIGSIVMGGTTGTFGVLVEEVDGYTFSSFHKPVISAFIVGSILGFVLSNILLMGVIGGAVNTILVCFAAGPFEFHQNHPRLSQEMRESWSQQVWEDSSV